MKYCVYQDGTTVQVPDGAVCASSGKIDSLLVDEFQLPDTSVEVHDNMGLVDLAIVALFVLPMLFSKRK